MPRRKKSFFERLTGSVNINDDDRQQPQGYEADQFDDDFSNQTGNNTQDMSQDWFENDQYEQAESFEDEGELAVDVYETPEHIVVQAMVAGVRPDAMDVSISREECTISGRREAPRDASPDEYLHQELYWGAFSRTVNLPEEVEVEEAEANENHGLLTIKLPKINKDRETKLEIQSE